MNIPNPPLDRLNKACQRVERIRSAARSGYQIPITPITAKIAAAHKIICDGTAKQDAEEGITWNY
jgi:hypothetical protein